MNTSSALAADPMVILPAVPSPLQHPKTLLLQKKDSIDMDFSPQVLRAIEAFRLLLDAPADVIRRLYRPIADSFTEESQVPRLTDDELDRVISGYLTNHGFDIIVAQQYYTQDPKNSSYMKIDFPRLHRQEVDATTKPLLILDVLLSSYDRGNRQYYLTFTRLLHESAYALTPGLDRICFAKKSNLRYEDVFVREKFETPPRVGPIERGKGDCGAGFEDLSFGGRIQPSLDEGSRPFVKELEMITVIHSVFPPTKNGNYGRYRISDSFLETFLSELEAWSRDTARPFPSLMVPFDKRSEIELHRADFEIVNRSFEKPGKEEVSKAVKHSREEDELDSDEEFDESEEDEVEVVGKMGKKKRRLFELHPHMRD